jgi:hypothetical protein
MIDNYQLVYAGVILLFLICATVVAMAGMILLAAGFAVRTAGQFRKRRKRADTVSAVPADEDDGLPQVSWQANVSHLRKDQNGRSGGRAADMLLVMNPVCIEKCPVRVTIPDLRR